jgi:NhaP-type Na+/H+ or K+/H+ antiporter
MKTDTEQDKSEILLQPPKSGGDLAATKSHEQEIAIINTQEPSVWRTIGRLLREAIFIVFFIGLHWIIKWWLIKTNQEHEWWAEYLLIVSTWYAVIAFTVIFGSELIVQCKRAIEFVWKNIRNK